MPLPHKARSEKFSNKIRAFDDISLVPRPIFGGRGKNRAWYILLAHTLEFQYTIRVTAWAST